MAQYSCILPWTAWVRAHEDGGRTASDGSWTLKIASPKIKFTPVCGLTELAGDFSVFSHFRTFDNPASDMYVRVVHIHTSYVEIPNVMCIIIIHVI